MSRNQDFRHFLKSNTRQNVNATSSRRLPLVLMCDYWYLRIFSKFFQIKLWLVNCSRLKTRAFEVLQNEHCLRSLVIKFPPDKSGNPYSHKRVHPASVGVTVFAAWVASCVVAALSVGDGVACYTIPIVPSSVEMSPDFKTPVLPVSALVALQIAW